MATLTVRLPEQAYALEGIGKRKHISIPIMEDSQRKPSQNLMQRPVSSQRRGMGKRPCHSG